MKYTKENYQEFALDYLENLMSREDRISFRNFLDQNPLIKEEIDDFPIVTLPQFEPKFLPKAKLIRPVSTKVKVFPSYLRRIAAAVFLLVMVSIFWLNKKENFQDLASTPINTPVLDQEEPPSQIGQVQEDTYLMDKDVVGEGGQITDVTRNVQAKKQRRKEKTQGQALVVSDRDLVDKFASLPLNQDALKEIQTEREISATEFEEINVAEKIAVVFIDQLTIHPARDIDPKLSAVREPMLKNEEIEQESRTKIGKLLAKANLLPTGLREEIASGGLRDKIIPESYTDSK
jgi:hypothetical protein